MPFVNIKTNVSINKEIHNKLHNEIDHAIALIPAVEIGWTMTNFEDNCCLWFENSNSPAAMVEISVFDDILDTNCQYVTENISNILNDLLSIDKNRIYIKFSSTSYWGCNGTNY